MGVIAAGACGRGGLQFSIVLVAAQEFYDPPVRKSSCVIDTRAPGWGAVRVALTEPWAVHRSALRRAPRARPSSLQVTFRTCTHRMLE